MRRVISLYLPTWPTDRARRRQKGFYRPEAPLITAVEFGNRRFIAACDRLAALRGLRRGQTVVHASALVSDLQIAPSDAEDEHQGLKRLALWCLKRYSPLVGIDAPDGIWIDATGCASRFGDEASMLKDIVACLQAEGIGAYAALADTTGAAHAVARYGMGHGGEAIIKTGLHKAALQALPIKALRLPDDIVDGLHGAGFNRIGQLYGVARAPLARRFGVLFMRRYDQAMGAEIEPIEPLLPPETLFARRFFAEPVTSLDYLAHILTSLVAELCRELEDKGLGAFLIDGLAYRVDNRIMGVRISSGRSSRDHRLLGRLIADKVPSFDLGFGIEKMELRAIKTEPFHHQQTSDAFSDDRDAKIDDLIDLLSSRVGRDHIYRVSPFESAVPERAAVRISARAKEIPRWPVGWPRPSLVLARPENISTMALLPDHAPSAFLWRHRRHKVMRSDGPERIFGEWWRCDAEIHAVRDYFLVEDEEGRRFWIFRRGDGADLRTGSQQWFMHGFFA